MATRAVGLTDSKIQGMSAPEKGQREEADAKVPGLRIRVGSTGAKTFIVRKRVGGKVRNISLGRYHERRFTLADARKKARTLISDIEAGADPKPRSERPGAKGTVRALFDDYLGAKAGLRSIGEIQRIFEKRILPEIGDRLADAVTRADVTELIDSIEAPVMARAVAAQLSAFYSWALPRLPRLDANPARDAGRPMRPKARDRVLSDDELRALWKAIDQEPVPFGPAIRMLILTLQRRDEVFSADCSEFDRATATWTIPGERAKNGKAHVVPLSAPVMTELTGLKAWSRRGKLFPARGNAENGASGFSKAWRRIRENVDKRLERTAERFTIHDLRRTGATGLQQAGVRLEVTEAILNHVSGSRAGVVGVYQRYQYADEKREALASWAGRVKQIVARKGRRP